MAHGPVLEFLIELPGVPAAPFAVSAIVIPSITHADSICLGSTRSYLEILWELGPRAPFSFLSRHLCHPFPATLVSST